MSIEQPRTNLEAVIRYHTKGDIILNAEQEELMNRLSFADTLLRSRKYKRDDIVEKLKEKYGISRWRGHQDITDTHKLFGETRRINKNYLIGHHIDEIGRQIQSAFENKRFELLPKLNDNYTYALNSLPANEEAKNEQAVKMVYVLKDVAQPNNLSWTDALKELDEYIKKKKIGEYIPFETVAGRPEDHSDRTKQASD